MEQQQELFGKLLGESEIISKSIRTLNKVEKNVVE
jgi:hypothetical protein